MFQQFTKEQARTEVARLVENFTYQLPDYKRGKYNETEVRVHYINPFFKALGWDVNNDNGASPAYCEVIHEARVLVGKASKAPDYLFKMPGGQNLFFLEAKKPSVDIKGDVQPAYQVRRYGWNAKMALSLLTDFEELAVYDCTVQPNSKDKSSKARIHYLTFDQYLTEFDFLWDTFSKESVLRGNLDRFVAAGSNRRGKETVDRAFLDTLEQMRAALAQGLASRNRKLDAEQLRFLVQMLLDRIIFLRIAEDRGVEPEDDLKKLAAIKAKDGIYLSLLDRFRAAAARYNSGLFDLEKDTLSAEVRLDNATLKPLLDGLYYPESPYEFSVIGAEILGSAYERFLGKVIQLQPDCTVLIEEKPEVRKAGGVFYTPAYIVDYIVKNTVGKLCEGSSPQQVAKLRIVDPACGSGSFLLGAYQFLLDWHLAYYQAHPTAAMPPTLAPAGDPKKAGKPARPTGSGKSLTPDGRLTTAVKKTILLNNLYGVDLDEQAVEVTKLSLLLKCLEGETSASMQQSLGLERVLPTIDQNIRVGNSLVDVDFYDGELDLVPSTERAVKPFSWREEFAEVFQQGGFDAVIGNPPYVLLEDMFRDETLLKYFRSHFDIASYKVDLYHLFFQKGVRLLNSKASLAYITPSNYLTNNGQLALRNFMLTETFIEEINIINGHVFEDASVDTAITILSNKDKQYQGQLKSSNWLGSSLYDISSSTINQKSIAATGDKLLNSTVKIKFKVTTTPLSESFVVKFGMQLRDRKIFLADVITTSDKNLITPFHTPCYTGKDFDRYQTNYANRLAYFNREAKRGGCWDESIHFAKPKIMIRQIGKVPICSIDEMGYACLNTLFMVVAKEKIIISSYFLLGILNSKLLGNYWSNTFYDMRTTFPKIKGSYLEQLPIPTLNLKKPTDQQRHDAVVALVKQLLTLHPQMRAARLVTEQSQLQARLRRLDQRLDHLVYLLYGLNYAEAQVIDPSISHRLTEAQYPIFPSN
ncbi:protein of unknown function DUF450 [Hymenobacter roseosalivarius DSM 11622]|uniref:site-specific DNA-methyltransferase (adenine-specific) n=1 Tax=Hymenobacter roseosalivarius DSM 11622 TaxID=645990 RepID=A0A1W1VJ74_9BACT|nr:TaqI-like C-terminal specificity domain-containing protein [Hymenobacter roseosalivarius]SMB93412.1 protein of unknown function DUF450 [Hymenobacter roseosalivarius DSM 11622]